ncbi:hypothetical protein [Vulgatibacter sp.]|uniref:GspE/PulE/PilB domain-containing protein n=1 Tax=Vulgatibacter sp. TaxID=1971226 RepID=UPI0035640764
MSGESSVADRRKLGELLVAAGVLDEGKLQAALVEQQRWGEPLGRTLVNMGVLSEELLVRALSRQLGIPACDPATMELDRSMAGYIGLHLVEQFGVMPVAVEASRKVLFVATADPTDKRALAELGDHIGWSIQPVVAASSRIEKAIRKHYYGELGAAAEPAAPVQAEEPGREQPTPPAPPTEAPPPADFADLRASIAELERLAGGQLRALRVLVEMLVEKGVVRHEDYLARVRGEDKTS